MFKKTSLSVAAIALAGSLGMGTASAESITFMTGPAGGSWYPLGGAIKNIAAPSRIFWKKKSMAWKSRSVRAPG